MELICYNKSLSSGLEIATDMAANATNIFTLGKKNFGSVDTSTTSFFYDLDYKTINRLKFHVDSFTGTIYRGWLAF